MTLKLAVRIEGDASGLRPATDEARRQLQGVKAEAAAAGDQLGRAFAPTPSRAPAAPAPSPAAAPANVVPFTARSAADGLRRDEWVNLSRQMQDVVTMGAMGASPMQILSSQGAQIFDIFTSAQAGPAAALKAVAPFAAAVAGLGVTFGVAGKAAYDFSNSQDEVERSLRGIGRLSGATVAGINAQAEASAGAARVSVATAREMSATFAATGKIGPDLYGDLTVTAARYARTAGIELPDATQKLAQALADPVKGAVELNKTLGFLSGRTLELIERQTAMGDRAGAQRTAMEALKTSLVDVTSGTNGWALAWDKVSRAAKDAYDATGQALQRRFAPTPAESLQDLSDRYRSETETAPRRGLTAAQLQGRERRIADIADIADRLEYAQEDARRRGAAGRDGDRQAEVAEKTLKAKGIVQQLTPTMADIQQLQTWRTELQEALKTGDAPTGTAETLARVNRLLAQGGTEASQLRDATREAFNVAGLLPYQRGLAEIETRYRRLVERAGDKDGIASLLASKADEMGAYRVQNTDNVVRDQRMRIAEMVAGGQVQRQSMYASSEAAATMAARQELVNEAFRNGQTPVERYGGQLDALAAQMGKVKAAEEEFQRVRSNIVGGMDELRSGSRGVLTGLFSDTRQGRNPLEGLKTSLGSMADRLFDRTVSKPLLESVLRQDGKAGGGVFGDVVSKIFGSTAGMATGNMNVTAASVVVNGGAGAITGSLGLNGGTTGPAAAAGGFTEPLGSARTLVSGGGRVLSYGGSNAGALPISVNPSGTEEILRDVPLAYKDALPSWIGRGTSFFNPARGSDNTNAYLPRGSFERLGDLQKGMTQQAEAIRMAGDDAASALDATASGIGTAGSDLIGAFSSVATSVAGGLKGAFSLSASAIPMNADGGLFVGRGGPRSDSNLSWISNGEYIVNAASTTRHRGLLDAINFGAPSFADGGYAGGYAPLVQPTAMPGGAIATGTSAPSFSVNITNEGWGRIETSEPKSDGRGGYSIDMIVRDVEQKLAANMQRGRGPLRGAVLSETRGAGNRVG